MRRAFTLVLLTTICFAASNVARAEHQTGTELRGKIETWSALLDSHTRRLYYEIRDAAEGNDEQAQLLSESRELWRAARRLSDRAMDGVSATKLEREVRHVEDAFHAVEERFEELRQERVAMPPVRKRLQRIDGLVHAAHDHAHELLQRESTLQGGQSVPQRPGTTRPGDYGYRTVEPLPRIEEAERRAVEIVDPPAIRVGPDGFYFDGRRFTIPLGR